MWIAPDWGGGERPEIWDSQIQGFNDVLDEDLQFEAGFKKLSTLMLLMAYPLVTKRQEFIIGIKK